MTGPASLLTLKTVIGAYGYHEALKNGTVALASARLDIVDVPLIEHRRQVQRADRRAVVQQERHGGHPEHAAAHVRERGHWPEGWEGGR